MTLEYNAEELFYYFTPDQLNRFGADSIKALANEIVSGSKDLVISVLE